MISTQPLLQVFAVVAVLKCGSHYFYISVFRSTDRFAVKLCGITHAYHV